MMSKKRSSASFSSKQQSAYRTKHTDFVKIFKDLPFDERLIYDCSCALQKNILYIGRLYITQNWICFYSNILHKDTRAIMVPVANITTVTKEKSARLISNAIQVCTKSDRYFFASLGSRDKVYALIAYIWKKIHSSQLGLSQKEIWMAMHHFNGDDIGLNEEEEARYQTITPTEVDQFLAAVQPIQKSPLISSRKFGIHMSASMDDADQDKKSTDQGDASDSVDGNMNSLLRRKKKKNNSTSSFANGFSKSTSSRPSRSFGSSRSVSADDPDAVTDGKRISAEMGKSVSFDEEAEDQVFGKGGNEEENSRRESLRDDDNDDTLSVISENIVSQDTICGLNHEHLSYKIMDEVFSISIERMFELLFTNCPFQEDLAKRRQIFDVVSTPWTDDAEGEGSKTRTLNYTVPINISFCPKRTGSVEKQTMYATSKPGRRYMIDTESDTHGIPYGDTFCLLNRYCITRVTRRSCRLIITAQVKYRKYVLALIKNLVNKTCVTGMENNFGMLSDCLHEEEAKLTGQVRPLTSIGSDGGSSSSTPGDRSRPDGALTTKAAPGEDHVDGLPNGVKSPGGHSKISKHLNSVPLNNGSHSVLSTSVSGFLVVIFMLFIVLMCVNISLMVMLCTMDLPDLAAYSVANGPSKTNNMDKYSSQDASTLRDNSHSQLNSETSMQDLLSHISSLKSNLNSDLSRLDTNENQDANGSHDGKNNSPSDGRRKEFPNVDPTLKTIISLQSELHAAHLTRLHKTLSATTDLMQHVQKSLEDLLRSSGTVDADASVDLKENQ